MYSRFRNTAIFSFIHLTYKFLNTLISAGFYLDVPKRKYGDFKKDTLLILGAGETLRELDVNAVKKMKKKMDIAATSYSVIFLDEIDYFIYESPDKKNSEFLHEHVEKLLPHVLDKTQKGKLYAAWWKSPDKSNENVINSKVPWRWVFTWMVPAEDESSLRKIFFISKIIGLTKISFVQKRGTLIGVLNWAIAVGYKKILFSGVDLNSPEYFFETDKSFDKYGFASPYSFEKDKTVNKNHLTNDSNYGIPIIDVFRILKELYPEIEMYVTSRKSELSTIFPLYDWK